MNAVELVVNTKDMLFVTGLFAALALVLWLDARR